MNILGNTKYGVKAMSENNVFLIEPRFKRTTIIDIIILLCLFAILIVGATVIGINPFLALLIICIIIGFITI